jgi:hypothetical protein
MSLDTLISLYIHAPFGAKTTLNRSHFEGDSPPPHIAGTSSLIWIKTTLVRIKHASLIGINYLETQSR